MSDADRLLDLARHLRPTEHQPRNVIECYDSSSLDSVALARFALALKLAQQPLSLQLRAAVEEWDLQRIGREVH